MNARRMIGVRIHDAPELDEEVPLTDDEVEQNARDREDLAANAAYFAECDGRVA